MLLRKENKIISVDKKKVNESLAKSCKDLISPNIFSAENFKRRSRKVEWDDMVGGKPVNNWKEEKLAGNIIASSLPELAQKFMDFVADHSGDSSVSKRTPFVDVNKHTFTVTLEETRKGKPLDDVENGKQYFQREYSCTVSMINNMTEVLADFASIRGQLESNDNRWM